MKKFTLTLLVLLIININSQQIWELKSSGPWGGREGLMGVSFGEYIYMAGGRGTYGLGFYNDVWRSLDGSDWEQVTDHAPFEKRSYHVMLNYESCIWIMGGQNFGQFFNDVWKSCDGKIWELVNKQSPWAVRAGLAATVYKGEMYVTGGSFQTTPFSSRSFYNDVWKTKDGINWDLVTKESPWTPVSGPRLVVMNDIMYIVGGENGFSEDTQFKLVYSTTDGKNWNNEGDAEWVKRSGHGVVVYQNQMYVIAGYLNLHDIWVTKDAKNWTLLSNNAFNCDNNKCGRFDFWALEHKGNLVCFGGTGAKTTFGSMYNESWSYPLQQQTNKFLA